MALSVKRFPVRQKRVKQWQRNVRRAFDSFACELLVITLVIFYALIIFTDLAYTAARDREAPEWDEAMRHCDLVLLSVFMLEICLRLFGFGLDYLRDCINVVDAVVVLVSWVITLLPPSMVKLFAWFRLFRILRLFRFAVIINKLQRSREAAAMMRKRSMYRKAGAPVEKVLDFFEDLRSRMPEKKHQEYLSWMMEVVCEGDLYRVRNFDADTVKRLGEGGGGDDISSFISQATHYLLLTTYYSLLTTHYSLLTTYYSLPVLLTTDYSPLTTHYSLLTTHYSPLTTHHSPLTTDLR